MSSLYKVLCLSHSPMIVAAEDANWQAEEPAISAVRNRQVEGHEGCDLVIGRYSYPLIEVICVTHPPHSGSYHPHAPTRVSTHWPHLLWAALQSSDPVAKALAEVAQRRHGQCWPDERLRALFPDVREITEAQDQPVGRSRVEAVRRRYEPASESRGPVPLRDVSTEAPKADPDALTVHGHEHGTGNDVGPHTCTECPYYHCGLVTVTGSEPHCAPCHQAGKFAERKQASATPQVKGALPWRVGRKVGRTVYDAHDNLIGTFDTRLFAFKAVSAVNRAATLQQLPTLHPYTLVKGRPLHGNARPLCDWPGCGLPPNDWVHRGPRFEETEPATGTGQPHVTSQPGPDPA